MLYADSCLKLLIWIAKLKILAIKFDKSPVPKMLFVLYHCIPTLHHKNCTVMKLPPEYFLRTDLYHVEVCVCSPTSLTCVRYCLWSAIQQASYFCVRICHLLCRLSVFTLSMFHAEFVPFQWLVQRLVNIC